MDRNLTSPMEDNVHEVPPEMKLSSLASSDNNPGARNPKDRDGVSSELSLGGSRSGVMNKASHRNLTNMDVSFEMESSKDSPYITKAELSSQTEPTPDAIFVIPPKKFVEVEDTCVIEVIVADPKASEVKPLSSDVVNLDLPDRLKALEPSSETPETPSQGNNRKASKIEEEDQGEEYTREEGEWTMDNENPEAIPRRRRGRPLGSKNRGANNKRNNEEKKDLPRCFNKFKASKE
ncbi:hypothetical protein SUGI_0393380 [Cryptomeria japonica]|nr:hypothetical protein SUGI_0393380 [Cryptomeria japonica]